jgi:hypothetical protein
MQVGIEVIGIQSPVLVATSYTALAASGQRLSPLLSPDSEIGLLRVTQDDLFLSQLDSQSTGDDPGRRGMTQAKMVHSVLQT